jgi:hypothetical protein
MATTERTRTSQRRTAATAEDKGAAATRNDADAGGTAQQGSDHPHTATVNLPFVTAQFRTPDLHLPKPRPQEIGAVLESVRTFLPSPQQALYYGGLALMAAVELVEWPVVAAIAVGTALARRGAHGDSRGSASSRPRDAGNGGTAGSRPRAASSSEQKSSGHATR